MEKKKHPKKYRFLRILGRIVLGLIIFIFLLLLFIRSPWGQNIIVQKLTSYISNKTHTKVSVEKVFITFAGNVYIKNLYLEDKQKDTLIFSKDLEANIALMPLIKGTGFHLKYLNWKGVTANIHQEDSIQGFNYQFLINAFVSDTTQTTQPKDTSGSFKLDFGKFDLQDIHLTYKDDVTGMDARGKIGALLVDIDEFDLEQMIFKIDEVALKNTRISYYQTKPLPETKDSETDSPLPYLVLNELSLENVSAIYKSDPDGIDGKVTIGNSYFTIPEIDLTHQKIVADEIHLVNSDIQLRMTDNPHTDIQPEENNTQPFQWPDWEITLNTLDLDNNHVVYSVNNGTPKYGKLNPDAFDIKNLTIKGEDIYLKDQSAGLTLSEVHASDASGIQLKQMVFTAELTDKNININDIDIALNNNQLKGDLTVSYHTLNSFLENPENASAKINISYVQLFLKDVFNFQPGLQTNPYIAALSNKMIYGNVYAQGTMNKVKLSNTRLNWGSNTNISTTALLTHLSTPEKLGFDISNFKVTTIKKDMNAFIATDSFGLALPDKISLTATGKGTMNNVDAKALLKTPDGNISVQGNFKNENEIAFDTDIRLEKINLQKILQNPALDTLTVYVKAAGKGSSINTLDATLETDIKQLSYNGYDLTPLKLSGEITNGAGNIAGSFKDYNLNAKMDTRIVLDSVNPQVHSELNVIGADLNALRLTGKKLKTQLNLTADYIGNIDDFSAKLAVNDLVMVYENDPYYPGNFMVNATVKKDSSSVTIHSKMLEMDLQANADITNITNAFSRYYDHLMSADSVAIDTLKKPVNVHLRSKIYKTAFLEDVLLSGLENMDTITLDVDFKEKEQSLYTNIYIPYLKYGETVVDSLALTINAQTNAPSFSFGLRGIETGPIQIRKISFKGNTQDKKLYTYFDAFDDEEKLIHVTSTIQKTKDSVYYSIVPDTLILNRKKWQIPANNQIALSKSSITFNNFSLNNQDQKVTFGNNMTKIKKDHLGVEFEGFRLDNIVSILNPDKPLAKGILNGKFIVVEPYGKMAFLAGLDITDLNVLETPLGNLSLKAAALSDEKYKLNLELKDGGIDLDVKGNYIASETNAQLNLQLDLNKLELTTLEKLSGDVLKNSKGYLAGNLEIEGTTAKPQFNGEINFHETDFTLKMLDTPFKIDNEKIVLNNNGIYFNTFTIKDANNNNFVLDGNIATTDPLNPVFDLTLNAKDFQLLNASKEDNDLFYGKANINVSASLKGNMDIPEVNAKISANEGTDIYYVVPEETLDIEERDGVVVFVNRENPDAILTRQDKKTSAILKGFRLETLISLNKNAVFNVILDEQTGDNLRIAGKGDLTFSIAENGLTTLTGRYEVTDGHYEMNLYNLVKRKFTLAPESTVTWSGDPMDASLDVKAIYELKTSASSLMSAVAAGESSAVKNTFRQRSSFLVYLNVDGELMRPKLTFGLDMPEDERGISGGAVYSRIQQLNQEEDELNKQVFSLLVLGRFFPDTGSSGSDGGTATIARNNLNQALSDQLNMFSDKLLGKSGFQLNFDVDSYTDYQGANAQERTDVDISAQKKLFNDRVIVNVGSELNVQGDARPGENNQVIGNVSIEYLLTEDGRFSLKGFRKNSYENIIDGQLIVSGISLIFTKEFNKFSDLWKANLKEEEEMDLENPDNKKEEEQPQKEPVNTTKPDKESE